MPASRIRLWLTICALWILNCALTDWLTDRSIDRLTYTHKGLSGRLEQKQAGDSGRIRQSHCRRQLLLIRPTSHHLCQVAAPPTDLFSAVRIQNTVCVEMLTVLYANSRGPTVTGQYRVEILWCRLYTRQRTFICRESGNKRMHEAQSITSRGPTKDS